MGCPHWKQDAVLGEYRCTAPADEETCESCGGKVETDAPYDKEFGIDICLKCRTELRKAENYHPNLDGPAEPIGLSMG